MSVTLARGVVGGVVCVCVCVQRGMEFIVVFCCQGFFPPVSPSHHILNFLRMYTIPDVSETSAATLPMSNTTFHNT